jgi:branched-chain amino acid aminotransferase
MHRLLLHNDQIREAGDHIVSPGQVGLLNGWGVFSTIRVYDGVLFAWERHFARMQRDAARLRVPFPSSSDELHESLLRLIESNHAHNATLRVVVIRNQGGMWQGPAATRPFDVVAFTADVNQWGDSVRLGMVPHARHAANEFAGVKYLSWSENLTWNERAHEQGFDEVILLNERGEIAELTSANIFVVHRDRVSTPPLSSGCLPGITRAILVEIAGIEERTLFPADLESADEVFITSTTRELMPVAAVEGLKIRQVRAVTNQLQAEFTRYVQSYVKDAGQPVSPAGSSITMTARSSRRSR